MRADPGIGSAAAAIGTVEWAQHVRLTMQSIVHNLPKAPERFKGYVELCREHRAWTLLNKPDGSTFSTFEDYCAHKEPWGLGKPYDELRPFLEAATPGGARALRLVTVAPAKEPEAPAPGPGRGHKKAEGAECPLLSAPGDRSTKAVRAIAERTPEPARELYRRDLLGQKEAAKLGPKSPTPAEAERVTTIAITLSEAAKAAPKPTTEAERRGLKRTLTVMARELLGEVPEDRVAKLARTVTSLAAEDRTRFAELVGEARAATASPPAAQANKPATVVCSVCGNTEERAARAADIENVIERVMGDLSNQGDGPVRAKVLARVRRFLNDNYEGAES